MKIGIVGPSYPKWKSKEQIEEVKSVVRSILFEGRPRTQKQIILVSGHCPKGGVDIWAEEIADNLGVAKEIYSAEVNQWEDKKLNTIKVPKNHDPFDIYDVDHVTIIKKGYKSRNIQMAEACDILYCIVPHTVPPKGFDITNIDSFTMKDARSFHCIHCKNLGHPTNGGCWTLKKAKSLGKETHLVVIE